MQTLEIAMAELVGLRQNVLDRQPEFAKGEPVRRRPGQGLPVGGQVGDPRPGLIHQGLEQVFGLSRAGGELRQPVRSDEETADPQGGRRWRGVCPRPAPPDGRSWPRSPAAPVRRPPAPQREVR